MKVVFGKNNMHDRDRKIKTEKGKLEKEKIKEMGGN